MSGGGGAAPAAAGGTQVPPWVGNLGSSGLGVLGVWFVLAQPIGDLERSVDSLEREVAALALEDRETTRELEREVDALEDRVRELEALVGR